MLFRKPTLNISNTQFKMLTYRPTSHRATLTSQLRISDFAHVHTIVCSHIIVCSLPQPNSAVYGKAYGWGMSVSGRQRREGRSWSAKALSLCVAITWL